MRRFVAIEFKPELQSSGNAQFGSKSRIFSSRVTLKFDGWPWKQYGSSPKQHQASCIISSYVNSNWSYARKPLSWVLTSVTLTFDLWPWPYAWTPLWLSVITPANSMMTQWWEHSFKGVTDGQTDRIYHSYSCLVAAKKYFTFGSQCNLAMYLSKYIYICEMILIAQTTHSCVVKLSKPQYYLIWVRF